MRKIIIGLIIGLALAMAVNSFAYRIPSPPKLFDLKDATQITQLNKFLEDVWDVLNGRYNEIGNKKAGVDYTLTFRGEDNDGVITYYEDEDDFHFDTNVRVASIWHAYGGFQDEATTIACTLNVWAWITNGTNDLWAGLEEDNVTVSGDIITIVNAGDYCGGVSISISALNGKDYFLRVYNITQAIQMGYIIGTTTSGANNYAVLSLPLYLECNAGDELRFDFKCTTDGTDPTVRSAVFYITYLHD